MTEWDQHFVGEEVPGFLEFSKDGLGEFQFGYVRCVIDWRTGFRFPPCEAMPSQGKPQPLVGDGGRTERNGLA
jgi:hypothetical protein